MSAPVQYTPTRLRSLARIVRAERRVTDAVAEALHGLATAAAGQLSADGYTASYLDNRAPEWRADLAGQIMPLIADVFLAGYTAETRAPAPAVTAAVMPNGEPVPGSFGASDHLATAYLRDVYNRMVNVADDVFRAIAASLEEGRQAEFTLADGTTVVGESIPELAKRVEALVGDTTRWSNDGERVARTEVIGANNAGAHAAAYGNAELFGFSSTEVAKTWLNTHDHRTRPAHQDVSVGGVGGEVVMGLDTVFSNGLQRPGDPNGSAAQVIRCRCTPLFSYPGDPDYPDTAALTAAATPLEDPMTEQAPETEPTMDAPTHAGLAVQAADTGRILMLQRALDPEDPAAGKWEFPGGSIEDGETPLQGACREWSEETGMACPEGEPVGGWTSPDGVYECFVISVPSESSLSLNPDTHQVDGNPDDPDREAPEVTAWLSQEDVAAMGEAIRQEVRDSTDWSQFEPTVTVPVAEAVAAGAQFTDAVVLAGAAPPLVMEALALRLSGETYASIADTMGNTPDEAYALVRHGRALLAAGEFARDGVRGPGDGPGGGKGGGAPAGGPAMKRKGYREATGRAAKHDADAEQSMKSAKAASESSTAASHFRQAEQSAVGAQNAHEAARSEAVKAKDLKAQRFHENGKKAAADLEQKAGKAAKRAEDTGQYAMDDEETPPEAPESPVSDEQPPALAQDIDPDGEPFHGILAPEDVTSGDGRQFAAESIITRDLPLPLMAQAATSSGHDGAVRVGRIDKVWRDTTRYAKPMVRYSGVWDTSEDAQEAQRQVDKKVLRGISIDGDQVTAQIIGSDGAVLDPLAEQAPADGVVIEQCTEARVSGGTLCSVPAFQQAYIANGLYDPDAPEPGQDEVAGIVTPLPDSPDEAMVAAPAWSLVASVDAWVLPAAHFTNPNLTEPTALTVDEDGRVYGHLATWGQCHLNGAAGRRGEQVKAAGKCMEVPVSASNYAYFNTGVVHTDDGSQVNVGQLTMNTKHANLRFNALDAMGHYDDTGTVVADVTVGHDTVGIWFSGHLRPEATPAQVHALTASGSVSGDWREVVRRSGQLELVAALVVNVPGYPIGRPAITASAEGPTALVASGAIRPDTMATRTGWAADVSDQAVADFAAKVMAHMARTERVTQVRARARTHHAVALAARLNERIS